VEDHGFFIKKFDARMEELQELKKDAVVY